MRRNAAAGPRLLRAQRLKSSRAFPHKAGILQLRATLWWSWSDSNQPPECLMGISIKGGNLRCANAWWSWSDSNQPPKCYGTWRVSDQLPWSDTHPERRAVVVFRDFPGSWSDSNEQPDF